MDPVEQQDRSSSAPVPADVHRAAARMFASGVTVAAARHSGRVHASAATAFCSLSLDPPLVLLAVNRRGQLVEIARQAGHVGVSILGAGQRELSEWAATTGRVPGTELPYATTTARTGAPLFEGAIAWFDGEVQDITRNGDHIVIVALVVEAWAAAGADPLLYFSGTYHALGRSLGARAEAQGG